MDDLTSPEPARTGRAALLAAAHDALERADLDALIGFLGPRPLARSAGLSPGTVTHHFRNGREVAEALIDEALAVFLPPEVPAMMLEAIEHGATDHATMLDLLREAARLDFEHSTAQVGANSALYLACVVAPNDPTVAAIVRNHYDSFRPEMAKVYDAAARVLGRRFDEEHGFDAESVCTLFALITDGFLIVHRFDPGRADRDLFVETILRLFDAVTVPLDEPTIPVDERLIAHAATEGVQVGESAAQTLERIVATGVGLYRSGGWDRLDLRGVASRLGVRPAAVGGLTDGRLGLADLVWQRMFLADVVAAVEDARTDPTVPDDGAVHAFQRRLVEITHAHPRLSGAMLGHLVDEAARGAGAATATNPLYDLLQPALAPTYAAHVTHGAITGALLDRGPTERTADQLRHRFDLLRNAAHDAR